MGFWEKLWAPAEHIEIIDNLEVIDKAHDTKGEPEIVRNGRYRRAGKTTTVLWIMRGKGEKGYSAMSLTIVSLEDHYDLWFGKTTHWEVTVKYKGDTLFTRGRGEWRGASISIEK